MKDISTEMLSAGWSRIDITPKIPTPLDGMGQDYVRQANWIEPEKQEDRLKATVIVLSDPVDPSHRVVLCAMDTLFIHGFFSNTASEMIADALHIPSSHVLFCASHTHSGVSMDEPDASVQTYLQWLYPALVEAARKAQADLRPARVEIGQLQTRGMNVLRRYILKDGSHRSTVFDKTFTSEDIASYETEVDRTLRAIRLVREGGENIMLVNWQVHPGFTSRTLGMVSADMPGSLREYYEAAEPGCCLAFFQGAAGNTGKSGRWQKDPDYAKYKSLDRESYSREFVRLLREEMIFKPAAAGPITVHHSQITVGKKKFAQLLEETWSLPLYAVCFGDVAFCTAPAELFSDSGLQLRAGSGYKMTFFSTCTNGNYGYIPVKASFAGDPEFQSFEVRNSKCEPGTAEKIVEALLQMLHN